MEIRVFAPNYCLLGENPLWDCTEQRLYWLDNMGGRIFRSDAAGGDLRIWKMPAMVGAMALRAGGGALITLTRGVYLFDFESGELCQILADVAPGSQTHFNDGKVDRQGRFVTGTLELATKEASGALYRVDTDLSVHRLCGDIGITNGPCFSPDGRTFYCADSSRDAIYRFDYDPTDGSIGARKDFVSFSNDKGENGRGQPDGATVDEEGFLWTVAVYAGELRRYSPEGDLDRRIRLPLLKATSVIFGGPEMDILFLTTMEKPDLPFDLPEDGPLAGCVLAISGLGVRGIPETRFGG